MLRSRIHVDAENTQQQQQRHAHKTPGLKQSLGPQRQAQTAKPDTRTQNALGQPSLSLFSVSLYCVLTSVFKQANL